MIKLRQTPLCLLLALLVGCISAAQAHPIRPAIVTIQFDRDGNYDIAIQANAEAWLAGIGPQHRDTSEAPSAQRYDELRALLPDQLENEIAAYIPTLLARIHPQFDGSAATPAYVSTTVPEVGDTGFARLSVIKLRGEIPGNSQAFQWRLDPSLGSNVLKILTPDGAVGASQWLKDGAQSDPYSLAAVPQPRSWVSTAATYTGLGFTHIVPLGADHILFVLGIFLLSQHWRPLLQQVTAFTLAHSITLGLGIYGVVTLSPSIVEPLIALSIVYVGVENMLTRRLHAWRIVIVFLFGLLHGLGFAGVLTEIGLPRADFVTALITFNIGVELGQLAVISLAWILLAGWLSQHRNYRRVVTVPLSSAISLTGAYWVVTRIAA